MPPQSGFQFPRSTIEQFQFSGRVKIPITPHRNGFPIGPDGNAMSLKDITLPVEIQLAVPRSQRAQPPIRLQLVYSSQVKTTIRPTVERGSIIERDL